MLAPAVSVVGARASGGAINAPTFSDLLARMEARSALITESLTSVKKEHSSSYRLLWEYLAPNKDESLPKSVRVGRSYFGASINIGGCGWTIQQAWEIQRGARPEYLRICVGDPTWARRRLFFPLGYYAVTSTRATATGMAFSGPGMRGAVVVSHGRIGKATVSFDAGFGYTTTIVFKFTYGGHFTPIVAPPPKVVLPASKVQVVTPTNSVGVRSG